MPNRVVWESKVDATHGKVRLVEVEHHSVKYATKEPAFVLESARQTDALGAPVWMPVDLRGGALRDPEAIEVALKALGEYAATDVARP